MSKFKCREVVVLLIAYCLVYYPGLVLSSPLADERAAAGFISIDCGMTRDSRYDDFRNLKYSSDAGFIDTGTNIKVNIVNQFGTIFNTLRSFPYGDRNCYTLKPKQGKNSKYLIRAHFHYGNYDGLNSLPEFNLYIDVNFWMTIRLVSADANPYTDLIYAPPNDIIYVCLVKTGTTTPIISALELKPLNNSIYDTSTGALRVRERLDAGFAGNYNVSYSVEDDPYDRLWSRVPASMSNWGSMRTNISKNSTDTDAYELPPSVLETAAIPVPRNGSLFYSSTMDFFNTEIVYVYWHFAEIVKLGTNDSREFTISMTGNFQSGLISPKYLQPLTIVSPPTRLNGSVLEFSIDKTKRSTLPPILNALEKFEVVDLPALPTDKDDVNAIMTIKMNYTVPKSWQGDPCLPRPPWDGLNCSDVGHDSPRITSLNLAHSGLAGDIPHSLSALTALTYLNLSYNSLTGVIPEFLAELPSLRIIDLTNNSLNGTVPVALSKKVEDGLLHLSLQNNPDLCVSNSCKTKDLKKILVILGATTCIIVTFVALTIFYVVKRRRQAGTIKKSSIKLKNRVFTYIDVLNMTNNFRKVIGKGGSGSVYHGCLPDGTIVAVKILNPSYTESFKQFCTEAQLLTRVHHRNLVSLIGYCEEGTNMALIYEHVSNGNLQQHLSEENVKVSCWKVRLQIAIDTAQGLEYLHNGCKPPIIHRDMKSSNILLDDELNAKISDFGISRPFLVDSECGHSTVVAGTYGYVDPEYIGSGRLHVSSDVYSFGVVLLELITGQPCIIKANENCTLISWVTRMLERGDIYNIVDKRLQGNFSTNAACKALEIAMACVSSIGIQRPSMNQVLADLKDCFAVEIAQEREGDLINNGNAINQALGNDIAVADTEIQMGPTPR